MTSLQEASQKQRTPAGPSPAGVRTARRTAVRVFRPQRSLPAAVAAVSVAVVGGLAVAVTTAGGDGAPSPLTGIDGSLSRVSSTPWEAPEAMVLSAVAAAVGLTLVLTALLPGTGGHLALRTDDRDTVAGLTRRGLRDILAVEARGVDGVGSVRVRVRGGSRTVRIEVRTHIREAGWLGERVEAVVRRRVEDLRPLRAPRVVVRLREEA
ncbi:MULTISPECIES: DUF6286 domain-containing protein [Nocardiopsidaceae]|uniref:DUF6286 domain-containing protein n=1 Tax=Streptomonospora nanhaiensis TaxID=1323731 RepID=A0ABY6YMP0_9ACTN|nr:DUF6286 domain-containing protein [Streptomonospora nanhaiensis]WAE73485.1 DUF6286 domain-containing protein [Streptomonospora nanhaiensis]